MTNNTPEQRIEEFHQTEDYASKEFNSKLNFEDPLRSIKSCASVVSFMADANDDNLEISSALFLIGEVLNEAHKSIYKSLAKSCI